MNKTSAKLNKPKIKENDVVKSLCNYLSYRHIFFWRQNTAPVFDSTHGRFRAMPSFAIRGVPDIIAIIKGRFVGIEVKRRGGKMSDSQEEFKARCQMAGGLYCLAHSIDEFIAFEKEFIN